MRTALILMAVAAATPAEAGPWIDDKGRSTEMVFPGASPLVLAANGHTVADGVTAFDRLCLKTGFDRAALEPAVAASGWGFAYRAEMMPFKPPVDTGGWNAPDATLRMANGILFNKKPQCNLTFLPVASSDMAAVQAALTALLGTAPDNAAKQFDKKGKPKKYYSPEWTLTGSDGVRLKFFALPAVYNTGAFQLAALKN